MKLISDTYDPGYYVEGEDDDPYSSGYIAGVGKRIYDAGDSLGKRVLDRMGRESGTVTIVEDHWDSGYCVTCSSEEIDFIVLVDGEEVYKTPPYSSYSVGSVDNLSNFAHFNKWLGGEDYPDPYEE